MPMTPTEMEENLHHQQGTIGVLKLLLLELAADLPPARINEIKAALARYAATLDTMAGQVMPAAAERSAETGAATAREIAAALGKKTLTTFRGHWRIDP